MKERKVLFALILILLGTIIFLGNYIPLFNYRVVWPMVIIIIGLGIMFRDIFHD